MAPENQPMFFEENEIMKRIALAGMLALAVSTLAGAAESKSDTDARRLRPEQIPLTTWAPPAPSSTLKPVVWMDHQDLLYRPNDYAQAFVRVNEDAYITVINVDAEGVATIIFPNDFAKDNRVRGNTTVQLGTDSSGFRLAVSEPYGGNLLKVVASKTPIDWWAGRSTSRSGVFTELGDKGAVLARHLTAVAAKQPEAQLASTEIVFGVVPVQYASVQPTSPPPPVPLAYQPTPAPPLPAPIPDPVPPPPLPTQLGYPIPSIVSDFGLQLTATRQSYTTGDKIDLVATSERKCSLALLDVAPDGSYNMLFPNAVDEDVWLSASKATFLSGTDSRGKIQAAGEGTHTLLALCTANRTISQWLFGKSSARTQVVAKQPTLQEVMDKRPKGDGASATFVYTVSPK